METSFEMDRAFEMATSTIRFGPGITHEIGMDLSEWGMKRVLVITDPVISQLAPIEITCDSLARESIEFEVFDQVRVEPSDTSMMEAIRTAQAGQFDAFVAVGGGSSIDTAKVANLFSCYPADLLTYVNAPLGQGKPIPGPLKPLIAVPTTAGTGSETTGVAIFDLTQMQAKTGIAHRRLKPTLGIVDPDNTRTMPPAVAASTGLDVLCHAVESYTAIPYDSRPHPEKPVLRPAYQGSNPISDIWSEQAIKLVARYLVRATDSPDDNEARIHMLLASTYAGMGFGNAGVHLCHGMSYPVSSRVPDFHPPGYPDDHAFVPHGISVILNAPAVFRFTAPACPERHLRIAQLLGAEADDSQLDEAGLILADRLIQFMQILGLPNGLNKLGFTDQDADALAEGTLPQHRVTKLSPRSATKEDLVQLFEDSMQLW